MKKDEEGMMLNFENSTPEKMNEKITAMREGGRLLGNLLKDIRGYVEPGMTGISVDKWVRKWVEGHGAKVAYDMLKEPFPGAICISVNDQLVHGAPSDEIFEVGDKVSFDMVIYYKGYFTDAAFTMVAGEAEEMDKRLKGRVAAVKKMISVTESSLYEGIEQVKPGAHIGDIGHAVETVLRHGKLGVIENYIGHGIDMEMHEAPEVPNYGKRGHGYKLVEGDTICIEPMSCLGKPANYVDKDDNWSVKMKDGSIGCHVEHTILVTADGYEILTLSD